MRVSHKGVQSSGGGAKKPLCIFHNPMLYFVKALMQVRERENNMKLDRRISRRSFLAAAGVSAALPAPLLPAPPLLLVQLPVPLRAAC